MLTIDTINNIKSKSELINLEKEVLSHIKYPINLEKLIRSWDTLVNEIERGYIDMIYEYINDLSSRNLIDQILDKASDSLKKDINLIIKPLDDRFIEATQPIHQAIVDSNINNKYFWWKRIPKILNEDLKRDFFETYKVLLDE